MRESLTIALLQARETAMGFFRPILNNHNLTEQQWRVIRVLADHRSIDFYELACQTCILGPSMSGILTRMERDGLVFRLKPMSDQRKRYVSLTQEGHALYERARTQVEEQYRMIEETFSHAKMVQLTQLLEEFITQCEAHHDTLPPAGKNVYTRRLQRASTDIKESSPPEAG